MAELKDFLQRVEKQLKGRKTIAVDMPTAKMLYAVREKYKTVFPNLIYSISLSDKGNISFYTEIVKAMRRISDLANILLGAKGRVAASEEVDEFIGLNKEVDKAVVQIANSAKRSKDFAQKLRDTEEQSNTTLEVLRAVGKQINTGVIKRTRKHTPVIGGLGDLGYSLSGFGEGGGLSEEHGNYGGAVERVLALALGPLAPVASFGVSGLSRVIRRMNQRRRAKQTLGGEIGLTSMALGVSPSVISSFQGKGTRGTGPLESWVSGYKSDYSVKSLYDQYNEPYSNEAEFKAGEEQPRTKTSDPDSSLKGFFSHGAFNAPYTKRLLSSLEGANKTKSGTSGSWLGGILGNDILGTVILGGIAATIMGLMTSEIPTGEEAKPLRKTVIPAVKDLANDIKTKGVSTVFNEKTGAPFKTKTPSLSQKLSSVGASAVTLNNIMMGNPAPPTVSAGARSLHENLINITEKDSRIWAANEQKRREGTLKDRPPMFPSMIVVTPEGKAYRTVGSIDDAIQKKNLLNAQQTKETPGVQEMIDIMKKSANDKSADIVNPTIDKSDDPAQDWFNNGTAGEEW